MECRAAGRWAERRVDQTSRVRMHTAARRMRPRRMTFSDREGHFEQEFLLEWEKSGLQD